LRTENLRLQIDAVVAGLGLAALPKIVGDHHNLVAINQSGAASFDSEIWLLRRQDTQDLPHVGKIASCIEEIVSNNKSRLVSHV